VTIAGHPAYEQTTIEAREIADILDEKLRACGGEDEEVKRKAEEEAKAEEAKKKAEEEDKAKREQEERELEEQAQRFREQQALRLRAQRIRLESEF
jgi:membrane protein involved in colicin uptake